MPERILTRRERMTARLYTGALAHFVAGVIDWLVLLARLGRRRLAKRR